MAGLILLLRTYNLEEAQSPLAFLNILLYFCSSYLDNCALNHLLILTRSHEIY